MTVTGIDWGAWAATPRALDPYLVWADSTGFAACGGHRPGARIPLLIEATPGTLSASGLPRPLERIEVPAAQASGSFAKGNVFFTATAEASDLEALLRADGSIVRFQLGLARCGTLPKEGLGNKPRRARPVAISKANGGKAEVIHTVLAVIDDGCPFAHANLADAAGTRVRYLWDQNPDASNAAGSRAWRAVRPFGSGAEVDGPTLDAYRLKFGGDAYRALGVDRITDRRRPHGVGVCHLAAGSRVPFDLGGRRIGRDRASDLPIIFVQLPLETVADTTGGSIGYHVLNALHYISARSRDLKGNGSEPRVVVNLSYGSVAGPHDGTSLSEKAIAAFLRAHPSMSFVVAAGNANRDAVHIEFSVSRARSIELMLAPDHVLETYVEIWWPETAALDETEVQLWGPGDAAPRAKAAHGSIGLDPSKRCGVFFCKRVAQGTHGTMTLVAIRPTGGAQSAPAGRWRVEVVNRSGREIEGVHAWVERNDQVVGRRKRQQSILSEARVQESTPAKRVLSSLSNLDCSTEFRTPITTKYLVVGASKLSDKGRSDYSSTGPARWSRRLGPDGLAPADVGPAMPGLLVDGAYDGQWARMSGSSAAAAVTTRKLAADMVAAAKREPWDDLPGGMEVKFQEPGVDGWFRIEVS